jgi:flagellar motor switch protein FliN/FliY
MIETRSVEQTQKQEGLIGAWSRAVEQVFERLTNKKSHQEWARQQSGSLEDLATLEWWEAKYKAEGDHCVWIGIAGPAAVEIGSLAQALSSASSGEEEAPPFSPEKMVEALCEAFAATLSAGSGASIQFQGVTRLESAPATDVLYSTELTLTPETPGPMLVGFQTATSGTFQSLAGGTLGRGTAAPGSQTDGALGLLLDLELPLAVRFGQAKMALERVLELRPGSVIELEGSQDDRVDLMVNGSVVAKGEVVAVEGQYAIRILEVMSRDRRIGISRDAQAN